MPSGGDQKDVQFYTVKSAFQHLDCLNMVENVWYNRDKLRKRRGKHFIEFIQTRKFNDVCRRNTGFKKPISDISIQNDYYEFKNSGGKWCSLLITNKVFCYNLHSSITLLGALLCISFKTPLISLTTSQSGQYYADGSCGIYWKMTDRCSKVFMCKDKW